MRGKPPALQACRPRASVLLLFACLLAGCLAASCGGGSNTSPTPSTEPQDVIVRITASNRLFDKPIISVPPNSHVRIELTNNDADPHNIAIYNSREATQQLFVSQTIAGVGSTTSGEFDAPPPGTYFFRCDIHPVTMTGQFVVE